MSSKRKGILAIVYRNPDSFLIVKTKNENTSPVSGGVEGCESDEDAVIREVKEETNVDIKMEKIRKLPFINRFNYGKGRLKGIKGIQNVYLIEVDENSEIKMNQEELLEAKWMTKDEVKDNLTFDHVKEIFEKSLEYIEE